MTIVAPCSPHPSERPTDVSPGGPHLDTDATANDRPCLSAATLLPPVHPLTCLSSFRSINWGWRTSQTFFIKKRKSAFVFVEDSIFQSDLAKPSTDIVGNDWPKYPQGKSQTQSFRNAEKKASRWASWLPNCAPQGPHRKWVPFWFLCGHSQGRQFQHRGKKSVCPRARSLPGHQSASSPMPSTNPCAWNAGLSQEAVCLPPGLTLLSILMFIFEHRASLMADASAFLGLVAKICQEVLAATWKASQWAKGCQQAKECVCLRMQPALECNCQTPAHWHWKHVKGF